MAGEEYTVQVTADELEVLRQYRRATDDRLPADEVIERVVEALRQPLIYRLLQDWFNGAITLRIEFQNKRVTYVKPLVEGCWKTGREI